MPKIFRPASEAELATGLAEAAAKGWALSVQGQRTHAMLGRRMATDRVLDGTALLGPLDYDPAELVLTAPAGTLRSQIEQTLAARNHMLAFEPPGLDWLGHGPTKDGTIAGLVATNLAGPRRIAAGAVRDHVLGVRAVTGRGLAFKSGGRVVKNVTGYDLGKLLSGSFGTLAVLSEVTLRVVARPQNTLTLLMRAPDVATAVLVMGQALGCAQAVSGAAYLPAAIMPQSGLLPAGLPPALAGGQGLVGQGLVALRLEGFSETLPVRRDALLAGFDGAKALDVLPQAQSAALWEAVGAGRLLSDPRPDLLWRASIPPSEAARLLADFETRPDWRFFLDWGGGLVWLANHADHALSEAAAVAIDRDLRQRLGQLGGHGLLLLAPEAWRNSLHAFQPLSAAELDLSRRAKAAFDPAGILNPGIMHPEL